MERRKNTVEPDPRKSPRRKKTRIPQQHVIPASDAEDVKGSLEPTHPIKVSSINIATNQNKKNVAGAMCKVKETLKKRPRAKTNKTVKIKSQRLEDVTSSNPDEESSQNSVYSGPKPRGKKPMKRIKKDNEKNVSPQGEKSSNIFSPKKKAQSQEKTNGLVHQICSGPTMLGAISVENSVP